MPGISCQLYKMAGSRRKISPPSSYTRRSNQFRMNECALVSAVNARTAAANTAAEGSSHSQPRKRRHGRCPPADPSPVLASAVTVTWHPSQLTLAGRTEACWACVLHPAGARGNGQRRTATPG